MKFEVHPFTSLSKLSSLFLNSADCFFFFLLSSCHRDLAADRHSWLLYVWSAHVNVEDPLGLERSLLDRTTRPQAWCIVSLKAPALVCRHTARVRLITST
eukprot:3876110-Amphidinium_carterae.1